MDSIQNFAPEIQKRLHDFTKYLEKYGFTRPEVKIIGSILYGLLRKPGIHVTTVSSALSEAISLRTYDAIKNMVVFVMLASSFRAKMPWNRLVKICSVARLLTRRKIKDIPSFYL